MRYISAITEIASTIGCANSNEKCPACRKNDMPGRVYCCDYCWEHLIIECEAFNVDVYNLLSWATENKTYIKNKLDLIKYKFEMF